VTLRWRITLILAAVALGVGALAATASYLSTASELKSTIDDTLTTRASAVNTSGFSNRHGRDGDGHDGGDFADGGCPTAGTFQPASAAQLVSTNGMVTSCIDGGPTLPITDKEAALSDDAVELRTVSVDGERYRMVSTPWYGGGTLQIARSLHETDSLLGRLRRQLAGLVAVATAVAAALGWVVASRLARPITRLRDTAHHIATTLDLTTPVDATGSGEVGSLASSFAAMVAALRTSQEQQRRLVSDASHEMRTPLTSLRSNLDLIKQVDRLPAEDREAVVDDVLEDVDELSVLLGELVDLASDLAAAEPVEQIDLGHLARTVAARTKRRTGRTVDVQDVSVAEVPGRPRQLERAISNLVDNAVKYSGADTEVEIEVNGARISVLDRGRGIAADDLDRVFDRFYRAVDVRTEPGSGLGLSIVEAIVRSHGGAVFARNRGSGGAEVGFDLGASDA
jgi:two-component system, OmpR family, sensor histidine kinase MprB